MEDIQIFCEECVRIVSVASPCGHYELEQEESREVEVLEEEHKHNVNEEKSITPDTQFDSWEEILIAMVHDRPVLWDSRLALSARSKTIRDKLWKEISDALGKSADTVQKKWRNLRDTYIRCKGEIEMYVPSGSAAKKQKKPWKFYSNMKFLRDVMAPRSTISNLNLDSPPSSCSSQEMAVPSKLNKGKGTNQIENAILTAIENLPVPKVSRADGTKVNPICQQLSTILEQLPSRKKAKLEIEFLTKAYEVLHEEDK